MTNKDQVILVTGGSSGLGKAMCACFASAGHTVYGTSRREVEADGYHMVRMDVTDEVSVADVVQGIIQREGRIDVVVNNAGLGIQGPVEDIDIALAREVLETNVLGPHRVCRAVLPSMRERGSGTIVQISSIAANFGLPYRGFYSATKAALDRITEALRMEVRTMGIRVVTVQPGEFNTPIAGNRLRPERIGTAYQAAYDRTLAVLGGSMHYSRDPNELARVVLRIIENEDPGPIHRVARGVQRLSVLLKKLLPTEHFERMVMRQYE
ncbi:MAG: SDR family oxidoreductase [Flavobacteriales bacterium]|nr:SDR family oxidoreductase [Flavobacteriales bacterium]